MVDMGNEGVNPLRNGQGERTAERTTAQGENYEGTALGNARCNRGLKARENSRRMQGKRRRDPTGNQNGRMHRERV